MRKKLVWVLTAAMVLTCLFSGCGASEKEKTVTAESIIEEMNAKTEGLKSFEADMDMSMLMAMGAEGMSMDVEMSMDGGIQMVKDPEVTHVALTMEIMGMSMDMDVYTAAADGKITTYTGLMGEWQKIEEEYNAEAVEGMNMAATDFGTMTLVENPEPEADEEEGEVYVLTSEISGDDLNEAMSIMGSLVSELGGADLSQITANVEIRVYKDTMYPKSVKFTLNDAGEGTEVEGMTVKIDSLSMIMTYKAFDSLETIDIPEEALNAPAVDASAMMQ